jgi:gas vesicle protein
MSNQNDNSGSYVKGFFLGILAGGAIGALAALLYAPKPGKELRQDIAEKSGELYSKGKDYFGSIESVVGGAVITAVNEGKQKAQTIIESAKKQAGELIDNAEKILSDAKVKTLNAKENIEKKIDTIKTAAKAGAEAFSTEYNNTKLPE